MVAEDRINMDIYKVVTRAIAASDNLEDMATQLTQLLVGALGIKGSTIFVLNPDTEELEALASFGLSINYMNKGPILVKKSLDHQLRGEPIVIRDVTKSDRLQYPEDAQKEGISAIVSLPISLHGKLIGVLRLYHYERWDVSERDLDSLMIFTENIGLALMYTRLLQALKFVKETVDEVHPIWLD
ncbi:MAG: GAF domain-containing protein [Desulfobacteraceae bacterium]|jgi:GAF domain-containing protein|nr:GAF domain-containing protein [Desulfobacteraceae bacterium]MDH3574704.1 GAF domain-containing protein [Desulfobacteraceae bacterium]MDH3722114.1 GAF domain-containing protein [Desulfobacteraceae bacterium]MDH3837331.1 GAF domain-containing protein [Desulfobacteraceae bacterium]MDH3874501.1 GAF domain-containing protein [Desulfobacteraceae bacterium]